VWAPSATGFSAGAENDFMRRYLEGMVKVKKA